MAGQETSDLPSHPYHLHLCVGTEVRLSASPLKLDFSGFTEHLRWDDAKIEAFRQDAVEYFKARFGVDFSRGEYDPRTKVTTTAVATLTPVTLDPACEYRVLSSNHPAIAADEKDPSPVRIAEFVVFFHGDPSELPTRGTCDTPLVRSDTLSFACYRILVPQGGTSEYRAYDFFMRSLYPGRSERGNTKNPRLLVPFQVSSEVFGAGEGDLLVRMPMQPNEGELYSVFIAATWRFPGSR